MMIIVVSIILGSVVIGAFSFALGVGFGVRAGMDTERHRLDDPLVDIDEADLEW